MGLWFRLRRVTLLVLVTALTLVACWLTGNTEIAFPSILGEAGVLAPLKLFLALPVVICYAYCLDGQIAVERHAPRHTYLLDLLLIAVPTLGTVAASGLGVAVEGLARNVIGLCGVLLLTARLVPVRYSALPAVVWTLAAALAGRAGEGFHPWAWPVLAEDLATWTWAGAAWLIGAAAYLRINRS